MDVIISANSDDHATPASVRTEIIVTNHSAYFVTPRLLSKISVVLLHCLVIS